MSMLGEGLSSNTAGESEQGANAALTELEKGLRSPKIGEQAEAIVRFPRLFEKYPFPILVNSGMLKLAELFRQGPNFLKMCVLRVCQESERQLDKVTSVDELVRRLVTVINSNDPVARALTLRVLGSIAGIIPERAAVHHKVRSSLDSQDTVELEAAMYAATRFAARSKTFSVDMCPKLLQMISSTTTSLPVKLKLIPIFQHMHHDAATAAQVRTACLSMLPHYPGQSFLLVTLHTLTSLATHTLVDVDSQVDLLVGHLTSDARQAVRLGVLKDLLLLSGSGTAHLWSRDNIDAMIRFGQETQCSDSLARSLTVLRNIIAAGEIGQVDISPGSPLLQLCETGAYSTELPVAARGTELLTVVAVTAAREGLVDVTSEAVQAIESLCFLVSGGQERERFTRCLKCVVDLCTEKGECTDQFVDILGGMLGVVGEGPNLKLLCETLAALGNLRPGVLSLLLPDIVHITGLLCEGDDHSSDTVVLLNTLLLQTVRGRQWPESVVQCVDMSSNWLDYWGRYKLARAASRYGHHQTAANIYYSIEGKVASETNHYWLSGLCLISRAEDTLCSTGTMSLSDRLSNSLSFYQRAISSLRSATTPAQPLQFQLEFVTCRVDVLTVLSSLVSAASSLATSPPPAIAGALATQSRDELQRCGRVTPQLRLVVKQLAGCAASWAKLSQASFDSDSASLATLRILQQGMASLATWVEMVCLKSNLQGSIYTDTEVEFEPALDGYQPTIELQGLVENLKEVATRFRSLASNPAAKPISDLHTTCLTEVVAMLTSHPLPYPRFFYQSLQQTKLKLAVSPQPRAVGEPVAVNTSQYLAVKVEGVIQRQTRLKESTDVRKVAGVNVMLNCGLQKQEQAKKEANSKIETNVTLEQRVEPHNDFFSAQFLVPFPVSGMYTVNIDTVWLDIEGNTWRTGASASVTVKSFEDRSNNTRTMSRS